LFRYTILGEHRDETEDPVPLKYKPRPGTTAQKRDRVLKLMCIAAIVGTCTCAHGTLTRGARTGYIVYLAVTMIMLFAQQTDDPPLKTRIYAPPLGSGQPNFPAIGVCSTYLNHGVNLTHVAYSTRGNATSAVECIQYTNGTIGCDDNFPHDNMPMWRVKLLEPAVKRSGRRNRRLSAEQARDVDNVHRRSVQGSSYGGGSGDQASYYYNFSYLDTSYNYSDAEYYAPTASGLGFGGSYDPYASTGSDDKTSAQGAFSLMRARNIFFKQKLTRCTLQNTSSPPTQRRLPPRAWNAWCLTLPACPALRTRAASPSASRSR